MCFKCSKRTSIERSNKVHVISSMLGLCLFDKSDSRLELGWPRKRGLRSGIELSRGYHGFFGELSITYKLSLKRKVLSVRHNWQLQLDFKYTYSRQRTECSYILVYSRTNDRSIPIWPHCRIYAFSTGSVVNGHVFAGPAISISCTCMFSASFLVFSATNNCVSKSKNYTNPTAFTRPYPTYKGYLWKCRPEIQLQVLFDSVLRKSNKNRERLISQYF